MRGFSATPAIFKTPLLLQPQLMRILVSLLLAIQAILCSGQFSYVRKLSYPDQLPTQAVYDMLIDSKGYVWMATDKGLYRFNGRSYIDVPFQNGSLKAVSYLQEDAGGTVWCMNFHNQVYYFRNDTLRRFAIDPTLLKNEYSFTNITVGKNQLWLNTFSNVMQFDKKTHRKIREFHAPGKIDPIVASGLHHETYYALTNKGSFFEQKGDLELVQGSAGHTFKLAKMVSSSHGMVLLPSGNERQQPVLLRAGLTINLPRIKLPAGIFIFQVAWTGKDEFWLCTQNGAYAWNIHTGETHCYLPGERISDVVRDYQGNYWFSTLDNGVFVCPSLENTLYKIYRDPLRDNFMKLEGLPSGKIVAGNSQGLLVDIDLEKQQYFHYDLTTSRETEFIRYDTLHNLIFTNRGVFREGQRKPVNLVDYSKGISRDRYDNLLVAVFNGAMVMNNRYTSADRVPDINNPLYKKLFEEHRSALYDEDHEVLQIRAKRALSILGAREKDRFWVAFEDALYEYRYDGKVTTLQDQRGEPLIGKCLVQMHDGRLVVGTSNKGVVVLKNGKVDAAFSASDGLSSQNVRKILPFGDEFWVLTDAGFDLLNLQDHSVTNYLDDYGLHNVLINDVIIQGNRLLFATPAGILSRKIVSQQLFSTIRFPILKATSDGREIQDGASLGSATDDISLSFEALHYVSPNALVYRYRLNGLDTSWHTVTGSTNQVTFSRLAPGTYSFQVQALAGSRYKSGIRFLQFTVEKKWWQRWWSWAFVVVAAILVILLLMDQWQQRVLRRQSIKEQLLKSQLVALRAQMNPHFLYNVLNTVQGLVYGNRRAAAGELLGNFSDLMRKMLQASDKQLMPLRDEVENLRLYLELEKARFDEGFSYSIEMKHIDDTSQVYLPSLLLQPFAENAIKHGLMHKRGTKTLAITFEKTETGLVVTIDDNGVGRARSIEINERKPDKPAAFATQALSERMELFSRLYKNPITAQTIDKIDEKGYPAGTKVILSIPDYSHHPDAL